EPAQLRNVNITHLDIENALESLLPSDGDAELTRLIEELKSRENYTITVLNRFSGDPEILKDEKQKALSRYQKIGTLANTLLKMNNQLMISEVQELRLTVDRDKKKLMWQTLGLIFFTVLVSILFISLIFKPIKQIDKGIEHLGDGDFQTPIAVTGPRDLENLGKKLDWLRKRLAELDREKVKLIAHISHDLKTPLASIKEGSGLLRDELVGPINNQQKEVVNILEKNCSKLQRLIEDILNFNMANARELPLQKNTVQLDKLIDEVVADHRNSMLARNIKLDVQLVSVAIYGNRKQLKTVFDNLLSNAVKFTPDQGVIRILLKADDNIATCLVEDSGAGIEEKERSQIFSPFFKGKMAEKSLIKGSGLGLAISREYIQNHGGTIRVLPGKKGARFTITLPATA
ncbi:MAG: HAMP domain-containing histidine kinase, partial [Desulfobulbaceae bacterium]|nr:HAMP domain-containing histidine kinase [Desulfobulbaceae bacterium]